MALFQVQLTAAAKRPSRSILQLLPDDSQHAFVKKMCLYLRTALEDIEEASLGLRWEMCCALPCSGGEGRGGEGRMDCFR